MNKLKQKAQEFFSTADITLDGNRPWDIQVHSDSVYRRVFANPTLGLGETYVDGGWDCKALDQFFTRFSKCVGSKLMLMRLPIIWGALKPRLFNLQTKSRSLAVAQQHYDIGNDLYQKMLDKRMLYTCAYWKNAKTLDQAQEAKLGLICRKLGLKPGMRVLDVGSGWGSFAKYAAEKHGVSVVGVNISKEQVSYGIELCKGLPVEFRLQDYRDINEKFDRIVAIGMIEHVGHKNYKTFMRVMHRNLKDDGLFLLHGIGGNSTIIYTDSWIHKYIFPGGEIPSIPQLGKAMEGMFVMEDWHNFGADYDKTLMAWFANFDKSWPSLQKKYGDRFYRAWKFYLLSSAGSFRARKSQLWQIVLSKHGVHGGYVSIR